MTRHTRKKIRRFVDLPLNKKGDAVIKLKGRMSRHKDLYGGKFYSHMVLDEPGRPQEFCQSFDFYFPGSNKFTLWNACIISAKHAFWEKVDDMSFERVWTALDEAGLKYDSEISFEPDSWSSTGKVLTYRMVRAEAQKFDVFDGRTFDEQRKKVAQEIIENERPVIYERYELDRGYSYGIGLHAVLDVEAVNREVIEKMIDHFMEIGERAWQADTPVPDDTLPRESYEESLKAGKATLLSNAVRM